MHLHVDGRCISKQQDIIAAPMMLPNVLCESSIYTNGNTNDNAASCGCELSELTTKLLKLEKFKARSIVHTCGSGGNREAGGSSGSCESGGTFEACAQEDLSAVLAWQSPHLCDL